MRSRTLISLLVAAVSVTALAATALPATAAAKTKAPKVKSVGTDPDGDWGTNVDPTLGPLGAPLGQDLVSAAIGNDSKTVNFVIGVSSLPPTGGMPEFTRYTWELSVDGAYVELDGKYTNYSRGACDPTGNSCPPPRDPGQQPFIVRGDCASNGAVVVCNELGIVKATFDSTTNTITIPVPLDMIHAHTGTKIAGNSQADSGFTGVSAQPSAFYSHSSLPYDSLVPTKVYTVHK
ncbi:MAG TPA: hypothetical protein VFK89_12040 [Actinomycetota bacterium]|nr:hypothetical protein [Actinomycetota bacterium]